LRALARQAAGKNCGFFFRKIVEKILRPLIQTQNTSGILPRRLPDMGPPNFSTILLQFFLVWKNLVHPDWLGEELKKE
jgi:hypothetical protein